MTKYNVFLTLLLCCLFYACNDDFTGDYFDDVLEEENPASNTIDIDGHDFVVRGDIDGEEFVINHESQRSAIMLL
jgi:hypothetical protein